MTFDIGSAGMLFIIDLDLQAVIYSSADRRAVALVEGKRGDDSTFELAFVRNGTAEALPAGFVITFGAKQAMKYDGPAAVLHDAFTQTGTGSTTKYTGQPSFNTEALNDLFFIDGNDANDVAFVDLMAEFSWEAGGKITSTKTFTFRVHNDVVRGDEGTPAVLPDPAAYPTLAANNVFGGEQSMPGLFLIDQVDPDNGYRLTAPDGDFAIARFVDGVETGFWGFTGITQVVAFDASGITATRSWTMPDRSGTLAALPAYVDATAANAAVSVGDVWWDTTLKKARVRLS